MTRAELEALAARCEAAQGPDRGLDADIAPAVGGRNIRPYGAGPEGWWTPPAGGMWVLASGIPAYTATLDDAASLVPEGCKISVLVEHDTYSAAKVRRGDLFIGSGGAATPALALCAAALRARAEERNASHGDS